MSTFVDSDWITQPRATVTVHTDTPQAKVTYTNGSGGKFRVIVTQKPNPIGFHARLPGDAPKRKP